MTVLRFVNADTLADSDPLGAKLAFIQEAVAAGYDVTFCFIGIPNANISEERVSMRVSQGGHDVPTEKLKTRFPRTMENLKKAIAVLPKIKIYDNSELADPFRLVAIVNDGVIERFPLTSARLAKILK